MTAPGDLGLARAYISGDLNWWAHPGDPYPALQALASDPKFKPSPLQLANVALSLGLGISN